MLIFSRRVVQQQQLAKPCLTVSTGRHDNLETIANLWRLAHAKKQHFERSRSSRVCACVVCIVFVALAPFALTN